MERIRRQIEMHRMWVEKHASRIEEDSVARLAKNLADASDDAMVTTDISLGSLALVYCKRGLVALGNDKHAPSLIAKSIAYRSWELRVRSKMFFADRTRGLDLTNLVSKAACLACCGEPWASRAESTLRRIEATPGAVDPQFWEERMFEPFVLSCYDRLSGTADNDRWLGESYSSVLESWTDLDGLGLALKDVCDYHCRNMNDRGKRWYAEFQHPPFDLIPCEVLLVRYCRERLNLPMPEVDHELVKFFDTHLSDLPVYPGDSTLERVAEVFADLPD